MTECVVEMDRESYTITSVETMIFWNFDSFMAQLIVQAMDDAMEHPKFSFMFSSESQEYDDQENRWHNQVLFVQEAFEKYLDPNYPKNISDFQEFEEEKTRRIQEALPILGEIYEGLWN